MLSAKSLETPANIQKNPKIKKPSVMAIIPAYNESVNIRRIIEETSKYVNSIVVIDDGSKDNTAEIATQMNVKVIRNRRNMGKGLALKKGLIESSKHDVDIVITLDADGQHDPTEIPLLLKPIERGEADVVVGSRYVKNSTNKIPKFRGAGLFIINRMNKYFFKTTVNDSQSGFRAYEKNVLRLISKYNSSGYGAETEQLASAELHGFRIVEVPVNIRYHGLENTSKKHPVLHGANILSTILKIAVERKPLLFFGITGVILIGMAIVTSLDMLHLFNKTRYFSIPLALITLGLTGTGSLLIVASLVLHVLKRILDRYEVDASFKDTIN